MKNIFLLCLSGSICAVSFAQTTHQLDSALQVRGITGSVLVAKNGNVLLSKGYGYQQVNDRLLNTDKTIYEAASITKQMTAAVVLKLQEEGKLSVKDKLSRYFPELPFADKLTLHHLLSHTSGIYNYLAAVQSGGIRDITKPVSQQELIALFKDKPLVFEPGSRVVYSNSNYLLLGMIIEKLTGKKYEQVVRERILTPLGMTSSGFDFASLQSPYKAAGYLRFGGADLTRPAPIMDSTLSFAAGALYSTVGDLHQWVNAYGKKILKPSSWQALFTMNRDGYGYGVGIGKIRGHRVISHPGATSGFNSFLYYFPDDQLTIIHLTNNASPNVNDAVLPFFFKPPKRETIALTEEELKSYTGKYEEFSVSLENASLKLKHPYLTDNFSPAKKDFFLGDKSDAEIEFIRDTNGKVTEGILYLYGMQRRSRKLD